LLMVRAPVHLRSMPCRAASGAASPGKPRTVHDESFEDAPNVVLSADSLHSPSQSVPNCTPWPDPPRRQSDPASMGGAVAGAEENGCAVVIGSGARRRNSRPPASRITKVQRFGPLAGSGSISSLSCKTTLNKELRTSSFPLYSMKPNLRNLFMKKLTRARVVPIISANVS